MDETQGGARRSHGTPTLLAEAHRVNTLMLAAPLAALDQTIVSTALPIIAGDLGGLAHLPGIVTAYMLAATLAAPIYGKLGDLFGRRATLQSAIVLFLFGSALCGFSRNLVQLIGFRALRGLGGGGLLVTIMAAIRDLFSPRERGRYQGWFGAVFTLATGNRSAARGA